MDKLKEIRSFNDLKEFVFLYKDEIRKAALPVTVAAALLFFWIWGAGKEKAEEQQYTESAQVLQREKSEEEGKEKDDEEEVTQIYADIGGCVNEPGVYQLDEGTRLFQLIEKAGGLTENADTERINRAEVVRDGQKIRVYEKGERGTEENQSTPGISSDGRVNINTADSVQLQEIPGIGPVTAEKIIEYRQANGSFSKAEDIKNVSGIGEKTFEKLKEYITVG